MDEKKKALEGATVQLVPFTDSTARRTVSSNKDGSFQFTGLPLGYYKLSISYIGLQTLILDSIHDDHTFQGDRAASPEFTKCVSDALDKAVTTGEYDTEHCKPKVPWYAAHPFWYALGLAVAVFVVGGVGILLYWLNDASPGKQHTLALLDRSLKLGVAMLRKGSL